MNSSWACRSAFIAITILLAGSTPLPAQQGVADGQWPYYGGDAGSTKYSALDQITAENVSTLKTQWFWGSPETARIKENRRLGTFAYESTPLLIDGVLYVSSSHSDVIAVDPVTGKQIWAHDTGSWKAGRPTNLGFVHRGVAYWADGDDKRIYIATGDAHLVALAADSGEPILEFGEKGRIDLTKGLRRPVSRRLYAVTSPPIVCRGTVVVGSSISDGPTHKEMPPGDVRGFDVRTGKQKWVFKTIPEAGEFGVETWEKDSWKYTGNANCWTLMSADNELGYVYLPLGTPTNDWYGGHRHGDGLFGESLVCVNAETGERIWHFQHVHHGVWDYDFPAAPALVDITVNGTKIPALAQVTKQGFCWVLDRSTGKPVWPIEERPVPQSTVSGEKTAATQPFPTKPPPFEVQGVHEDDLINFTPELRAAAKRILEGYHHGPLFTPPMVDKPTIYMPGWGGAANWMGCSVDPETSMVYIPSMRGPIALQLAKPDAARSNFNYIGRVIQGVPGPRGLPLFKPPYTSITAIDLNSGDIRWKVPIGDGPRNHELLKEMNLPPLGDDGRPFVLTTRSLLLVAHAARTPRLYAFDKATGKEIMRKDLAATPSGAPMTYLAGKKQYICIPVGGQFGAGLYTLALPD